MGEMRLASPLSDTPNLRKAGSIDLPVILAEAGIQDLAITGFGTLGPSLTGRSAVEKRFAGMGAASGFPWRLLRTGQLRVMDFPRQCRLRRGTSLRQAAATGSCVGRLPYRRGGHGQVGSSGGPSAQDHKAIEPAIRAPAVLARVVRCIGCASEMPARCRYACRALISSPAMKAPI